MAENVGELPEFDALWDYSDPVKTEATVLELVPRAEAAGDVDYLAQLLTQAARTRGMQRKFEEAHQTLDKVEPLLGEDTPTGRIRYLLERGRAYNSSKVIEKARPNFVEAWELARSEGADFYAVDAAHVLGICEEGDTSLEWNEKAMVAAEASLEIKAKSWLGALYNNTGWTYHDLGNYEKALELFQKGVVWREERGPGLPLRIAKWTVARTLRSMGRFEEALELQLTLMEEHREAGTAGQFVLEELGECLLALDRVDEARPYFVQAYEHLSEDEWLKNDEPDRLERVRRLGEGAEE
jgi:tetratricopeptide (TPR) repeat protein